MADPMSFSGREVAQPSDLTAISALAWQTFAHNLRAVYLPYRLRAWALDEPLIPTCGSCRPAAWPPGRCWIAPAARRHNSAPMLAACGYPTRVNVTLSIGCGVCTAHCPQDAIELMLAPEKGFPLEMEKLLNLF